MARLKSSLRHRREEGDKPEGVSGSIFTPERCEGYIRMLLEDNHGDRFKTITSFLYLEKTARAAASKNFTEKEEWEDATNVFIALTLCNEQDLLSGRDLQMIERGLSEFQGRKESLCKKAQVYHDLYLTLRRKLYPELYKED